MFSCIQYKSRIRYKNICIEITLLFIGINKYLLFALQKTANNIPFCLILFFKVTGNTVSHNVGSDTYKC